MHPNHNKGFLRFDRVNYLSLKSKNVILVFNLILHLTYANLPEIVFDVIKTPWLNS